MVTTHCTNNGLHTHTHTHIIFLNIKMTKVKVHPRPTKSQRKKLQMLFCTSLQNFTMNKNQLYDELYKEEEEDADKTREGQIIGIKWSGTVSNFSSESENYTVTYEDKDWEEMDEVKTMKLLSNDATITTKPRFLNKIIKKSFFYMIVGERFTKGSGEYIAISASGQLCDNIVVTKQQLESQSPIRYEDVIRFSTK